MTPDFSPFSYTLNNPVNFIDEFGLMGSGWNTRGREKTEAETANQEAMDNPTIKRVEITQNPGSMANIPDGGSKGWYQKAKDYFNTELSPDASEAASDLARLNLHNTASPRITTNGGLILQIISAFGSAMQAANGFRTRNSFVTTKKTYSTPSITKYKSGTFSISDFNGYPTGVVKPRGPFRVISGQEYLVARNLANKTNASIHKSNSSLKGKEIHEIHPVKFGGSPTAMGNKAYLTPTQHRTFNTYWLKLLNDLNK